MRTALSQNTIDELVIGIEGGGGCSCGGGVDGGGCGGGGGRGVGGGFSGGGSGGGDITICNCPTLCTPWTENSKNQPSLASSRHVDRTQTLPHGCHPLIHP